MSHLIRATVTIGIFRDSLGDGWADINAAGRAYASLASERITQALAEAGFAPDVTVSYCPKTLGLAPWRVEADDNHDLAELIVQSAADDAWREFCEAPEAQAADGDASMQITIADEVSAEAYARIERMIEDSLRRDVDLSSLHITLSRGDSTCIDHGDQILAGRMLSAIRAEIDDCREVPAGYRMTALGTLFDAGE